LAQTDFAFPWRPAARGALRATDFAFPWRPVPRVARFAQRISRFHGDQRRAWRAPFAQRISRFHGDPVRANPLRSRPSHASMDARVPPQHPQVAMETPFRSGGAPSTLHAHHTASVPEAPECLPANRSSHGNARSVARRGLGCPRAGFPWKREIGARRGLARGSGGFDGNVRGSSKRGARAGFPWNVSWVERSGLARGTRGSHGNASWFCEGGSGGSSVAREG
jgi:hypothetical protein